MPTFYAKVFRSDSLSIHMTEAEFSAAVSGRTPAVDIQGFTWGYSGDERVIALTPLAFPFEHYRGSSYSNGEMAISTEHDFTRTEAALRFEGSFLRYTAAQQFVFGQGGAGGCVFALLDGTSDTAGFAFSFFWEVPEESASVARAPTAVSIYLPDYDPDPPFQYYARLNRQVWSPNPGEGVEFSFESLTPEQAAALGGSRVIDIAEFGPPDESGERPMMGPLLPEEENTFAASGQYTLGKLELRTRSGNQDENATPASLIYPWAVVGYDAPNEFTGEQGGDFELRHHDFAGDGCALRFCWDDGADSGPTRVSVWALAGPITSSFWTDFVNSVERPV